jgi:hypothetical protein
LGDFKSARFQIKNKKYKCIDSWINGSEGHQTFQRATKVVPSSGDANHLPIIIDKLMKHIYRNKVLPPLNGWEKDRKLS